MKVQKLVNIVISRLKEEYPNGKGHYCSVDTEHNSYSSNKIRVYCAVKLEDDETFNGSIEAKTIKTVLSKVDGLVLGITRHEPIEL